MTANSPPSESIFGLARRLVAAGISVIPIRPDGSKAPPIRWEAYIERLPTEQELTSWFKGYKRGIAALGGSVSGGLECIDFDEPGLFERWTADVELVEPGLLQRVVLVRTPMNGAHVWFRSDRPEPNQVLAKRPLTETEQAEHPRLRWIKRIETRGAGGYALLPGSPAECHPMQKPYTYNPLGLADLTHVERLTLEQREILFSCCRAYSTFAEAPKGQTAPPQQRDGERLSPGTDYERRGSWAELLEPLGWRLSSGTWDNGKLTRPDKKLGHGATIGHCKGKGGEPLLNVFTTSAGLEPGAYGLFRAYTFLHHRGDYSAAARVLGEKGFGEQRQTKVPTNAHAKQANAAPNQQRDNPDSELVVRSLKGRKAKPVRYLVEGKIPVGKATMIAGVGGMGKSTLTRHLIACLTTGRPAFGMDYKPPPPCDVLLASVEDDPEDTILPHLLAEGADLDRVKIIEGIRRVDGEGKVAPFDLRDLDLVLRYAEVHQSARALIIDPIMSFVGRAGVNENASGEVRSLLDPLSALSNKTGIASLLIAHLSKNDKTAAINRIIGSSAFRDTCRVVYSVGVDPADDTKRVLALMKENIPGLDRRSIAFTREALTGDRLAEVLAAEEFSELDAEDMARIEKQLAYVRPLGFSEVSADGMLGAASNPNEGGKTERCATWIREFLKEFAYPSDELWKNAERAKFSFHAYKDAKAALGREGTGELVSHNFGSGRNDSNDWWCGLGPWQNWIKRPVDTPISGGNGEEEGIPY